LKGNPKLPLLSRRRGVDRKKNVTEASLVKKREKLREKGSPTNVNPSLGITVLREKGSSLRGKKAEAGAKQTRERSGCCSRHGLGKELCAYKKSGGKVSLLELSEL